MSRSTSISCHNILIDCPKPVKIYFWQFILRFFLIIRLSFMVLLYIRTLYDIFLKPLISGRCLMVTLPHPKQISACCQNNYTQ